MAAITAGIAIIHHNRVSVAVIAARVYAERGGVYSPVVMTLFSINRQRIGKNAAATAHV